jgi:hypothetical protein
MKKPTFADNSEEKHGEQGKKEARKNDESSFIIIPIEVIYLIISFCSIVGRHVLRFVSKEFHQLAHKYGAMKDFYFWVETLFKIPISFYVAKEGHLSILKWMKTCFLTNKFSINNEYTCEGAALGGHLEVLKRYAQR